MGQPNYNSPGDCRGKEPFDTKLLALKVRGRAKKYAPLMAYRCKWCGKWHLGSKTL